MFRGRTISRVLGVVALTLGMTMSLTGCFRYHVEAEIHRDDTISGSFVLAFETSFVNAVYGDEGRFLADLKQQFTKAKKPSNSGLLIPPRPRRGRSKLSVYRTKGLLGYKQTFSNIPFSELEQQFFRIRHVNKRFIVDINAAVLDSGILERAITEQTQQTATAQLDSQPSGGPLDSDAGNKEFEDTLRQQGIDPNTAFDPDNLDVRIWLSFPGGIISSDGDSHGRSTQWQLKLDSGRNLHASAWDAPQHKSWLLEIFFGLCAIGLAVMVFQFLRYLVRKRSSRPKLAPEPEHHSLGFAGLPTLGGDAEDASSQPEAPSSS
ncbi:MAG: LppM family (lipo)protein [Mycobacteriales bacterium]